MSSGVTRREIKQLIGSYDDWYQTIHLGFLLDTRTPYRNLVKRLIGRRTKEDGVRDALPRLDGKRVFEIGCNAGLYTLTASRRGASFALGIDRNPVAVEQAKAIAAVGRRLGWPIGKVDFQVGDVNQCLSLLDDMDVLIACCVIYHLGPTDALRARIRSSSIRTIVLQGNTPRLQMTGQYNVPDSPHYEPHTQTWGNFLAGIPGMSAFVESCGFEVREVRDAGSQFPVVVAGRSSG
jgi:SAM-dependent methyltransferase